MGEKHVRLWFWTGSRFEDSSQDLTSEVTRNSFANCQQRKKRRKSQRENTLLRVLQGGPGGTAERCLGAGCKRASKTSSTLSAGMSGPALRKTSFSGVEEGKKIARKTCSRAKFVANLIRKAGVLPETRCSETNTWHKWTSMLSNHICSPSSANQNKPAKWLKENASWTERTP